MPTPFMHLDSAERLLRHPDLPSAVRVQLEQQWPAFYLGNVAPDVQAVNGMPREATHFYDVPPHTDEPAYRRLLAEYPVLADAQALTPAQAAFVAGYQVHLCLDLAWLYDIVGPYFFHAPLWDDVDRAQRRLAHFVLLTYLDTQALGRLPDSAESTLSAAAPAGMTPFVPDRDMAQWQDLLVDQLRPGAPVRTVEIYAERLRLTPEQFGRCLHDADWMNNILFRRVPLAPVEAVLARAIDTGVALITDYLTPDRAA